MSDKATTSYGTWANYSNNLNIDDTVADYLNGGGSDWNTRMDEAGATAAITSDYRDAINGLLPDGLSLCGNDFYGPYCASTEVPEFDVRAAIESIDLGAIVARHDVDA